MTGIYRFALILTVGLVAVFWVQSAEAFRLRRTCCCPYPKCFGDDFTCLEYEIYEIAPGDYLYYANYLEGSCFADPQPEPFEGVDYAVPQDCELGQCLPGDPTRLEKKYGSPCKWAGLGSPVDPSFKPPFSTCATTIGCHFECLKVCDENNHWKSYKVKIFDVCVPKSSRALHVAYQVDHFPNGVNPWPIYIGKDNCKCPKCFTYALCYCGKKVLLLTAD
jgi:hypothetical protein